MDFLAGNPLSTPVGQRIEQATNSRLQAEDWALNIEICDIINETDEGPKDAVRAIKKRIVGNKNFREVMLALTVLETCVKNCGHRFHVLVSTREFVEGVLVRTILPKNNPPMVVHDRVLSLIQAWADAFRSSPTLTGVVSVYEDLKKRGLEFPMTDLDALSPIHTPHRSVPETEPSAPTPQSSAGPTSTQATSSPSNTEPSTLSPQQIQKLKADIEVVRGNQTVMSEMLNQLNPSNAKPSDIGLLQQLYTVCRCMQERALELIPRLTNEGLIEELLAVNDDLNNAFLSYHRFERLRNSPNATQEVKPSDTDPANLIDLSPAPQSVNEPAAPPANQHNSESAVNTLSSQMANLSAGVDDEFDMFAQTRGSSLAEQRKSVRYEDPGAMEGLAGALDTRQQVTGVIPAAQNVTSADIEEWLAADAEKAPEESEGVCSEEFDKFLKERAKVADQLPSLSDTSSSTVQHQAQSTWQQDSSNDQLFML